jgi:hypothetical protein
MVVALGSGTQPGTEPDGVLRMLGFLVWVIASGVFKCVKINQAMYFPTKSND